MRGCRLESGAHEVPVKYRLEEDSHGAEAGELQNVTKYYKLIGYFLLVAVDTVQIPSCFM